MRPLAKIISESTNGSNKLSGLHGLLAASHCASDAGSTEGWREGSSDRAVMLAQRIARLRIIYKLLAPSLCAPSYTDVVDD
jgi:hypothetical protein